MTRRIRQELHARIASVFEQEFPGLAAAQPERLAHHHAEAGALEKAATYSLKAGLRALAQVMARELWPEGIHVVHVIIDGDIREENSIHVHDHQAQPEDISELIYGLHRQSKSAWTSEVDVRPWNINFWEHC